MQYLLSEAEYEDLQKKIREKSESDSASLQRVCTLAAQHVPVAPPEWSSDKTPRPWGCILTPSSPGYCDDCPVSEECPYPHKEWSQ